MLIEHIEDYLGPMAQGGQLKDNEYPIQSGVFLKGPVEGVSIISTIGLSDWELEMNERFARQELVIAVDSEVSIESVSSFTLSFAESVIKRGKALLKGEVVGPYTPLFDGTEMNAFYITSPWFAPDPFHVLQQDEIEVIFVGILPLYGAEAGFIRNVGWKTFERMLVDTDRDLYIPDREVFEFVT